MENVVIDFYKYTGAPNAVDKSASLGNVMMTMDGVFKTPFDVLNPSVIVQPTNISVRNFLKNRYNYVCVKTFNENDRYYFVDGMRALNDKLVELDLREDALMQYKEDIYTLQCFVNRCSSNTYRNVYIEDGARKFRMERVSITNVMTDTPSALSKVNIAFDLLVPTSKNVVLIGYNQTELTTEVQDDPVPNKPAYTTAVSVDPTYLPDIDRQKFALGGAQVPSTAGNLERIYHGKTYFLSCNQANFLLLQSVIAGADHSAEEVKNAVRPVAIALPFEIPSSDVVHQGYSPVWIGTHPVKYGNQSMLGDIINPCSGYLVVADFTLEYPATFVDYPPYSVWECFIPFCGWITIPATSLTSRMIVYYNVDYSTGQAQANLYDISKHEILWSGSCQMGVQIDISGDNRAELNRQETANTLNTILQVGGGAIAMMGGVYSENPVALAGGVVSIARGIGGGLTNAMNMIDRAQVGYTNGNSALYQPNRVSVRKKMLQEVTSESSLKPVIGLPCSKVLTLSVLRGTGFTNVADVYPQLNSGIMRTEWEEIVRLLKEGVYL